MKRPSQEAIKLLCSPWLVVPVLLLVCAATLSRGLRLDELWSALSSSAWLPWVPAAILVYFTGLILKGVRLRWLVSEESQLTVMTATNIVSIGYAANNILPARLGELVRAVMLTERTGLPFIQSLTIAILERIFDGLAILTMLLVSALFIPMPPAILHLWRVSTLILAGGTAFLFLLAAMPQWFISLASSVTSGTSQPVHDRSIGIISQVLRGLSFFRSPARLCAILGVSFSVWIMEVVFYILLLPCVRLPVHPTVAAATMSVTNLGILVPLTPGYLETYHFYNMNALQTLMSVEAHISVADAVALNYAVIVHAVFFVTTTIWGVAAFGAYMLKRSRAAVMQMEAVPLDTVPGAAGGGSLIAVMPAQAKSVIQPTKFWQCLCESLIGKSSMELAAADRPQVLKTVSEFLLGQISNLPMSLRFQLACGLNAFRTFVLVTRCQTFSSMSFESRCAAVESWAAGPIPIARKLFRPLRSLTLLAFFENETVRKVMTDLEKPVSSADSAKQESAT